MTTDTKTELAAAYAGDEGQPGDSYAIMSAKLYELPSRRFHRFQCVVHAERGSNQGHLEPHAEADLEGRGDSLMEAIDAIRDDVDEWDWLSQAERNQLLRTLEYDAEDNAEDE